MMSFEERERDDRARPLLPSPLLLFSLWKLDSPIVHDERVTHSDPRRFHGVTGSILVEAKGGKGREGEVSEKGRARRTREGRRERTKTNMVVSDIRV